jgi:hypothetical protein
MVNLGVGMRLSQRHKSISDDGEVCKPFISVSMSAIAMLRQLRSLRIF